MSGNTIFVTGGARSGKTTFALAQASGAARRAYVATAEGRDEEMRGRIAAHRAGRGNGWTTVEEPIDLPGAIARACGAHDVVVVDCLTLWLSNLMGASLDCGGAIERLAASLAARDGGARIVIVSNEVGLGIVPGIAMAREFRDHAGRLNQRVAAIADEVYLVIAGIPMRIKPASP